MIVLVKLLKVSYKFRAQYLLGFLFFILSCSKPRYLNEFNGKTMGTTYNIKIISDYIIDEQNISYKIDSLLVKINNQMSTWVLNSEISNFNSNNSDTLIELSFDFYKVVNEAIEISKQTNGAFDVTIFDLMSLWGFGPNPKNGIPNKNQIENILNITGWDKLVLDSNAIQKLNPNLKLDLNSIAKGYGVDKVHQEITSIGFKDIFVEIGGEVKCSGKNYYNKDWVVGIENPNVIGDDILAIVHLNNKAMATSGNYRNFVDLDGTILGHTIDPRKGYPIRSNILSATVISSSCIKADAWATALMVLDFQKGKEKIESDIDLDAIWILDRGEGSYSIEKTKEINLAKVKS